MDQEKIRQKLLEESGDWIDFQMNVPNASHMGGVWEWQIRTVRSVLIALLDSHGTILDDESLRTFMVEAEAIVNSLPLTVENLNYLEPLTPNHLLTLKSKVVLPPPGNFLRVDTYSKKRWRRVQYLINEFWYRWRKDFLQLCKYDKNGYALERIFKLKTLSLSKMQTCPVTDGSLHV